MFVAFSYLENFKFCIDNVFMFRMETTIQVTNLVVTMHVANSPFTPEEYRAIAMHSPNSEYNPARFHAIIQRVRMSPTRSATALIFRSSRVVLTGAGECLDDARRIAHRLIRRLQFALGHMPPPHRKRKLGVRNLTLRNMVGSAKLPFRVPAEKCLLFPIAPNSANGYKWKLLYDPLEFPALRCSVFSNDTDKKLVASVLAFNNGKLIITGAQTKDIMLNGYTEFFEYISNLPSQILSLN